MKAVFLFGNLDFDVERISDYPLPSGDIGLKACGPELTKSCLMSSSHIQIVTLVFILALVAMFLLSIKREDSLTDKISVPQLEASLLF